MPEPLVLVLNLAILPKPFFLLLLPIVLKREKSDGLGE